MQGPYCHQCGQPVKGLVRPLSGWLADFLDGVVQWDGRIPRTLVPLLMRPGFLTREYLAGRRVRYVTPVRLFLFLVIALFVAVNWLVDLDVSLGGDVVALAPGEDDRERVERIVAWLPQAERQAALREALSPPSVAGLPETGAGVDPGQNRTHLSWLSDELNERLDQAARRAQRDPRAFVEQMLSVAPQALTLMLPLFALVLKVFYLFSRRLYMEHLLVALHSQAFVALALLLILLLASLAGPARDWPWLVTGLRWMGTALWAWIPVYLLLAQKRIYGQGWLLTVLKYVLAGTVYLILLGAVSLGTLVASLLLW